MEHCATVPLNMPMSFANDAAFYSSTGEMAQRQTGRELSSTLPEGRDGVRGGFLTEISTAVLRIVQSLQYCSEFKGNY